MKIKSKKVITTLSIFFFILLCSAFFKTAVVIAQFKTTKIETSTSLFDSDKGESSFVPIVRYNRVQGLALGVDASRKIQRLWQLEVLGKFYYGFEDKFRYSIGLQKSFFEFNPLVIGISYFDHVSSQDDWFISYNENSAAALFLKEDFMDYYIKKGMLVYFDQKVKEVHTLRLEVEQSTFGSMSRKTNWALFGKKKNFRKNPWIPDEDVASVRLMWAFDWRDNPLMPMSGWYVEGKGEQTFGDSVDTQGLFLTLKRFQFLFGSHTLRMKVMLGTRTGCDRIYDQYLMDMGGIGSLVAYKDKEFQNGNRFFYATFRYLFNKSILGHLPLNFIPLYDELTLGVFAETGWLGFEDKNVNFFSGFESMEFSNLKSDVGLSLYVTEGLLRVDFAKRTDRAENAWRVTFRVMHQF